ncbi:MAG: AAA family ATPase, partial [Rubrivivax sp.]
MDPTAPRQLATLVDQITTIIVGKRAQIEDCVACLMAGGHLLIEDVPGVGKTLLARTLSASCALTYRRVQLTPDLLPADIVGASVWVPAQGKFEFRGGPVFT